jgi:hypothetical protein
VSIETLRVEIDAILKAEGITVLYDAVESEPGEWAEGEYRPETKTVIIDQDLAGYPDEPLTTAHEIGHHFDLLRNRSPSTPADERERQADEYMVYLAISTISGSTPEGSPTIIAEGPIPMDRRLLRRK